MTAWTAETVYSFTGPLEGGRTATHDVHVAGSGPPILIMQELPGIGPETLALAARLNAAGFTVYLPHLFGTFGKKTMTRNIIRLLCIRREFNIFARGRQSPIANWLRALVADISAREGGAKVGAVGMCLTGSFAIPLMAEDAVAGGVASQPSLPLRHASPPHMSAEEIAATRTAMDAKGPGLAMRYAGDRICTPEHVSTLAAAFGPALETVEIPGDGHALLTVHFSDEAYQRLETYFLNRFGLAQG